MKKCMYIIISLCLWSCSDAESEPEPVSTVDSNLADPSDTVPPELYIDAHAEDTTFTIALDSAGKTILPEDTNYTDNGPN